MLDVCAADRIKPCDQVAFDATCEGCDALGGHYQVTGVPPPALPANVRRPVRFRQPRHHLPDIAAALRAAP